MGLDDTDDDIDAFGFFCLRRDQHFVGLADPWRGAEKNLQVSLFGLLRLPQKSVGRRPSLRVITILHARGTHINGA
jgi:hypothetical protein